MYTTICIEKVASPVTALHAITLVMVHLVEIIDYFVSKCVHVILAAILRGVH